MAFEDYRPDHLSALMSDEYTDYERLKEIVSRGICWVGKDNEVHHQSEINEYFGRDIVKELFCKEFDTSLYDVFAFARENDDNSRLLRNCGRSVSVHALRACERVKRHGGSLRSQAFALLHDTVENKWKQYIVLLNLGKFEGKNYQYITSLNFNFIEYDISKVNLNYLREQCVQFPGVISDRFGEVHAKGTMALTNMNSINKKLDMITNGSDGSEEKDMNYLAELIYEAINSEGDELEFYFDVLIARTGDREENTATMMYLDPKHRLRFQDKNIIHTEKSIELVRIKKIGKTHSVYKSLGGLLHASEVEALRDITTHSVEPIDGYKLEYRLDKFAQEFTDRLTQIKELQAELAMAV